MTEVRARNPLRAATLTVADLAAAVARYETCFDYGVIERGVIDPDLASSLDAAEEAGAAYVVMRPVSGVRADIRLIQSAPRPGYRPLRTFGWAAIEICVKDVQHAFARVQDSAFEVIGPPAAIATLPTIHPMQVQGPDGEIVFLTEIKADGPTSGLPTALAPIDSLFIGVMACRDMTATAAWVAARLRATLDDEIAIPYRMINRAFDLPVDQLHRLVTASRDSHIFLEFDQYPDEATPRPTPWGRLPSAVSVITLTIRDMAAVDEPWLTEPVVRSGVIYEDHRVGVLKTPEGTLIELVEVDDE